MKSPFKYEVGMYGGCFDVPHIGHMSVIFKAAAECRELYLVLSYSEKRDSVDHRTRYGWLKRLTSHLGNVRILLLEDDCATKEEYDADEHWERGAEDVKSKIGKRIDAVYCSDEYDRPGCQYRKCYPESEIVFVSRNAIPCSSTAIRKNPYENWEYIPDCVRPHYVKKILIVGNESTGKTTLVQTLAKLFNTKCVLEYGREICEKCGGEDGMTENDFIDILYGQKARVDSAVIGSNKLLFVDTDAITTSYYAAMNKDINRDSILFDQAVLKAFSGKWDKILFMESDVPYVQDGIRIADRNTEGKRQEHTSVLEKLYTSIGYELVRISGTYSERLEKCVEETRKVLGN